MRTLLLLPGAVIVLSLFCFSGVSQGQPPPPPPRVPPPAAPSTDDDPVPTRPASDTFEQLDANEDGWLSGTEMRTVKAYDTDGNGRVTAAEFRAGRAQEAGGDDSAPADDGRLAAIGGLTYAQLTVMHKYIASISVGFERDAFEADETQQWATDAVAVLPAIKSQLEKVRDGGVSDADQEFIQGALEAFDLIQAEAEQLAAYAENKDDDHRTAFSEALNAASAAVDTLFGNSPSAETLAKEVSEAAAAGNEFSGQGGEKYNELFTDANLKGFPANRTKLTPLAKQVADFFLKAAEQYKLAAEKAAAAAEATDDETEAATFRQQAEGLTKFAESKETFGKVALLFTDRTVREAGALNTKAKELADMAVALDTEARALLGETPAPPQE